MSDITFPLQNSQQDGAIATPFLETENVRSGQVGDAPATESNPGVRFDAKELATLRSDITQEIELSAADVAGTILKDAPPGLETDVMERDLIRLLKEASSVPAEMIVQLMSQMVFRSTLERSKMRDATMDFVRNAQKRSMAESIELYKQSIEKFTEAQAARRVMNIFSMIGKFLACAAQIVVGVMMVVVSAPAIAAGVGIAGVAGGIASIIAGVSGLMGAFSELNGMLGGERNPMLEKVCTWMQGIFSLISVVGFIGSAANGISAALKYIPAIASALMAMVSGAFQLTYAKADAESESIEAKAERMNKSAALYQNAGRTLLNANNKELEGLVTVQANAVEAINKSMNARQECTAAA